MASVKSKASDITFVSDQSTSSAKNTYAGQVFDGLFHGSGTFYYNDFERYEGDFVLGKREGRGKFYYADGSVYEGEWLNDKINGHGIAYFSSGNYYEGITQLQPTNSYL